MRGFWHHIGSVGVRVKIVWWLNEDTSQFVVLPPLWNHCCVDAAIHAVHEQRCHSSEMRRIELAGYSL
jgi:hypothetical protein